MAVTNLTPEEINRVLNLWMGWREIEGPPHAWFFYAEDGLKFPKGATAGYELPKYTESRDLCATIEAKLTDEQWDEYINEIETMIGTYWSANITREVASLTALQKATCLIRSLNLKP